MQWANSGTAAKRYSVHSSAQKEQGEAATPKEGCASSLLWVWCWFPPMGGAASPLRLRWCFLHLLLGGAAFSLGWCGLLIPLGGAAVKQMHTKTHKRNETTKKTNKKNTHTHKTLKSSISEFYLGLVFRFSKGHLQPKSKNKGEIRYKILTI